MPCESSCMGFFTDRNDSGKFASCSTFKDSISCGGSSSKSFNTTNLINHLKKKHEEEHSQYLEKMQDLFLFSFSCSSPV